MVTTHNLGYPRIGRRRELKFVLESYWQGDIDQQSLEDKAFELKNQQWQAQSTLDWIPVGNFSFYDHVLDTSLMLGNLPDRVDSSLNTLDQYFQAARGRSSNTLHQTSSIAAAEMTKWFDTNYHYLVPEFDTNTQFELHADSYLSQVKEALANDFNVKPVLIGPVSYLWLGKTKDGSDPLALLNQLLPVYEQLLIELSQLGIEWVQMDEPILSTELTYEWQHALTQAYFSFNKAPVKLLLANYFGSLKENLNLACDLATAGLHIDAINARDEVSKVIDWLPCHKILSIGVIDGRNIWKTDLVKTLDWLEPIYQRLNNRLWLAPSCSLQHVPVDLVQETALEPEVKSWLAFADQKIEELNLLASALNDGREAVATELTLHDLSIQQRQYSSRVHDASVKTRLATFLNDQGKRKSAYHTRVKHHQSLFNLPSFPTTTIGSFPQTPDIRQLRHQYKQQQISTAEYEEQLKQHIHFAIHQQETIGLDVLVHGEAERNDMVEYFGEQLQGYVFSQFGWVQSYGSRCVKPPIIYGDISRPNAMTVKWATYAQSLTQKPVKGMLTGPVTMLNWSFVRNDQPRSETCLQLALAIRDEVLDLEDAGIEIIQIDEAALREGLPLRKQEWQSYLDWAVRSFRISANAVKDSTQIHTHMCYSEFNDIIDAITQMDADVITIETSRSDMELLDVFNSFDYPNEIGPGVYDIHSPNIPSVSQITYLMEKAAKRIPAERLWVNPDCGLKTRQWHEVKPALEAMIQAARHLRMTQSVQD